MLRNKELRRFAIVFLLMAIVATALGFAINIPAGILIIACAVAFGTAFFLFTKARYQNIARVSHQIDLVLHNAERMYIAEAQEGELSILHSEITKMTQCIRQQNDALKKEKEHLADSLADIAHQLRTPLTSVNLILTLLAKAHDEKERRTLVREAEELLVRMDWLITALLKLSRLDAGIVVFQSEPLEVKHLIETALRPLQIPLDLHDINVQIDVPSNEPSGVPSNGLSDLPSDIFIQGDVNWLAEAIENILKNCMESAGDHGKIVISCTDNPLYTEILIHDSGAGFATEDLTCLFDRFYRGKNENMAGYGIGLALCRMIITRQGGTITAKNHPQGGAAFVIRFAK